MIKWEKAILGLKWVRIVLMLALLGFWVYRVQAREEQPKVVVDCEAGAQIIDIGSGRIRVVGYCEGYEYGRHSDTPPQRIPSITEEPTPEPDDGGAYPEPEIEPEPYPDMQRDMTWCEYMWSNGFECEE